jgi:hypothetical protein
MAQQKSCCDAGSFVWISPEPISDGSSRTLPSVSTVEKSKRSGGSSDTKSAVQVVRWLVEPHQPFL